MHRISDSGGQAAFLLLCGSKGTCKQPFCAIGTAVEARPIEGRRRLEKLTLTTGITTHLHMRAPTQTLTRTVGINVKTGHGTVR